MACVNTFVNSDNGSVIFDIMISSARVKCKHSEVGKKITIYNIFVIAMH